MRIKIRQSETEFAHMHVRGALKLGGPFEKRDFDIRRTSLTASLERDADMRIRMRQREIETRSAGRGYLLCAEYRRIRRLALNQPLK